MRPAYRPSILFLPISLPTAVMNAITTVPAACATTIASCRAVIWLTTWAETDGSGCDRPPVEGDSECRSPILHRLPNNPEIQLTPSATSGRRRTTKPSRPRDLEVGGLATADVGLPSCVFSTEATAERHGAPDQPDPLC